VPVVPAQPVAPGPGKIEVIDFFWYGCPHCFALEPYLQGWDRSKPANVVLVRVPAIVRPEWEPAARAYYTAQALGILDKAHEAIFNEIHLNNDQLLTEADFERFFIKQFGVSAKQFEGAWSSPAVDAGITQARILATRYNINILGVPMLAVNGRWLTGGGYAAYPQIMQVVNYLIQQEQAAMAPPAQ
jgi:thiol:disulfide interchange protein DsbA